jgi:hypothetical protein
MKLATLAATWLVLESGFAVGQPAPEPFRLLYTAFTGCPDQAQFVAWVTAKSVRARPAKAGEQGRTFVVSLRSDGGQVRGSLALVGPDGVTEEREITADDCEQAARAMSLVMALAIDPRSLGAPPSEPDDGQDQEESEPVAAPEPRRPAAPVDSAKPAPQARGTPWLVAGAGAEWRTGVVPDVATVPCGFAELRLMRSTVGVVTLGFGRRTASLDPGDAVFTYVAARFELCRWLIEAPVKAGPCAGLTGGGVAARGDDRGGSSELESTERHIQPWLEPGLAAKVGWQPTSWAELRARAGLGIPVLKPRYYFSLGPDDQQVVYSTPGSAANLGLEAGVVFR